MPHNLTEDAAFLNAAMTERGMSQGALAKELGTTRIWVHRRVTGKVPLTLDDLRRICAVLKIDPASVIDRSAA